MSATAPQHPWRTWYDQITAGDSYRAVAERVGMEHTSLYKHLLRNRPPAETVVAICRAYGTPPVLGLIETGYIETPEGIPALVRHPQ